MKDQVIESVETTESTETTENTKTTESEEANDVEETHEDTVADTETEDNPVSSEEAVLGDLPSGEIHPDTSEVETDVSSGDALPGDTSLGDVSSGDVSSGNPATEWPSAAGYAILPEALELTCTCQEMEVPLLWESDIMQYGITDGLLLLILIALILDIVFRR